MGFGQAVDQSQAKCAGQADQQTSDLFSIFFWFYIACRGQLGGVLVKNS